MVFELTLKQRKEKFVEVEQLSKNVAIPTSYPDTCLWTPANPMWTNTVERHSSEAAGLKSDIAPIPGLQPQVEPRHVWFILRQVRAPPQKKKMFALYEFTRRGDVWLSACQVSTRRGAYVNVRDDLFARSRQTCSCSCSMMYLSDGTCCVWLNNVPRGPQVAGAP